MGYRLTDDLIESYALHLRARERSAGTVSKYVRDVRNAARWLDGDAATAERLAAWRDGLVERGYAAATANSMVSAVNGLSRFAGHGECSIRFLRIQRHLFREESRHLSAGEYERLIRTARALGRTRLALVMEVMGCTGMRVSEVRFLTVEALRRGRIDIHLKGKVRTVLLPDALKRRLERYRRHRGLAHGPIFLTQHDRPLSRRQIWRDMKALCAPAKVAATKVFPHNLRHLFATVFYQMCHDLSGLADVLGHSSLETTRIYLKVSNEVHAQRLNGLPLLI